MPRPPAPEPSLAPTRDVWTVSRLNRETKAVLEGSFPSLWLQGELSSLAQPASGHLYFVLKDAHAQVRAAMFRPKRLLLRFRPANGQQVLIRARPTLYDARGEFQLLVEHMEPTGDGAWWLELERLKQRLAAEGLFREDAKRPLPTFPRQIGLITSPSGAAIRDLLTVLARRFRALPAVIYPVQVQGDGAAESIVRALALAANRGECDLLILARGGGSAEDLMAFNDERVVRAIRSTPQPVVTGIGHEIDVTLADLAADQRAATPSAAAELASPSAPDLIQRIERLRRRLRATSRRRWLEAGQRLAASVRHLRLLHPMARLQSRAQTLDDLARRLQVATWSRIDEARRRLGVVAASLQAKHPGQRLLALGYRAHSLRGRLYRIPERIVAARQTRFAAAVRGLEALSPLATLGRGFALVSRVSDDKLIRASEDAPPGTRIRIQLAVGRLDARVDGTETSQADQPDRHPTATESRGAR